MIQKEFHNLTNVLPPTTPLKTVRGCDILYLTINKVHKMIKNTFRSKMMYRCYVTGQYISQICSCSTARKHYLYMQLCEDEEKMRQEFIADVNAMLAKRNSK